MDILPDRGDKSSSLWVAGAVAVGVLTPLLIDHGIRLLTPANQPAGFLGWPGLLVWSGPFLAAGCFLGFRLRTHRRVAIVAGLFGCLSLGPKVVANIMVDGLLSRRFRLTVFNHDHNLWPFEILFYWLLAPIPMVLGGLLGKARAESSVREKATTQ